MSAGAMACLENDLKKLVAISTLSQLGLLMFSYCLGNVFFTFFHIVRHSLFKSLLFLTCGFIILTRFSLQDMRYMGSKVILRKSIFFMLFLSVLSLRGFPFLRGFFSKDLVIDLFFFQGLNFFLVIVFMFSCVLSVFYSLKFLYLFLMGSQISFSLEHGSFLNLIGYLMGFLFF